jgi:hypothetical protein
MSGNGSTTAGSENVNAHEASSKGKGKAIDTHHQDMSMDEDEESSEEELDEVSQVYAVIKSVWLRRLTMVPTLGC